MGERFLPRQRAAAAALASDRASQFFRNLHRKNEKSPKEKYAPVKTKMNDHQSKNGKSPEQKCAPVKTKMNDHQNKNEKSPKENAQEFLPTRS